MSGAGGRGAGAGDRADGLSRISDLVPGPRLGSVHQGQSVNRAQPFESDPGSGPLSDLVERGECPADWYKWSQAAYLRGLGWTWTALAKAVGVSERTVHRWKDDERWPVFVQHSEELWLSDVYQAARLRVLRALATDTPEALRLAERILEGKLPGMAQANGNGGGALPAGVNVGVVVGLPAADQGSRGEAIVDQARVLELGEIPDEER